MSERGSISLEAALGLSILMALLGFFFSIIYGSLIQGISYSEAAESYLRLNHDPLSETTLERQLSLEYSKIEPGFRLVTFHGLEDRLPIGQSSFSEPVEQIIFVTDTGSKYHRPMCPTVKLSLRPIPYREGIQYYTPCRVCYPKK